MTVSQSADIDVATPELRNALMSVLPHAHTSLDDPDCRVRFWFGEGVVYVMAANRITSALAKIAVVEDSRENALGQLDPDDGPMVFDLTPRRCRNVLTQFRARPGDPEAGQLIRFNISANRVELEDVGGMFSHGEIQTYPLADATGGSDVLAAMGQAMAAIGESQIGKTLVSPGKSFAAFRKASDCYGYDLALESVGNPTAPGFVISCGPDFIGTISSDHADNDAARRRAAARSEWLRLLPTRKLEAV